MTAQDEQTIELILPAEARRILGVIDPSTMYKHIRLGTFPKPIKKGSRSTRFVRSECEEMARKIIEARDER